ncbi:hypothetical protein B9Q17_03725 [Marinobacter vinifirmus]|uniref:PcRGLX/YetA-like N-terminal RIFT barrel domain-containing protein n=1 Tax=Marinobacter vinifirmus TaxID=355591 RepID=A0A7Z1INN2_9GAMM|nr:hypothetical protein [Marinobacter vinifirmus]OZC37239.1 hypothetical protein B9Q17_03725 [Marinobacter vinifirmus]
MATSVDIVLKEESGIHRVSEPLSVGIPFAKGQHPAGTTFQLKDAHGNSVPAVFKLLCQWPDGSIFWALAEFLYSLSPHQVETLTVSEQPSPEASVTGITQTPRGWTISTEIGDFLLHKGRPHWEFSGVTSPITTEAKLTSKGGLPCHPVTNGDWEIQHQNPVYVEASLSGHWIQANEARLADFSCRLRIYLQTGLTNIEMQIHNPKRARHPGGLWDLGDEGSMYFGSLELITETGCPQEVSIQPDSLNAPKAAFTLRDFELYQESSGGENWNSLNHIDKNGDLTTLYRGYRLTSENALEYTGDRANPLLSLTGDGQPFQLAMPTFWQNFPSNIGYQKGKIIVGLFPARPDNQSYELQGGERKTLRHLMAYANTSNLTWAYAPLCPRLAPEVYESTDAFPWFKANAEKDALDTLIQEGLDGPSNFFQKREVIDEYGWRNFGDIFADHETLYQAPGEAPLISHYNNQYDAIYGFARQFALTGDRRWFELMDDLARHVTDIDIYHTEEDRAEYNNGLFWHTDHYLPAHTATHRTFSRHNDTSSTPGQTGGGPGAEHCYTSGLLYHYLLTGNMNSRESVLELARWMVNLHEGGRGLLAQLMAMKRYEVPKVKALIMGQKPSRHRYPFTRATGNYINTLLDAAILEPNRNWLTKAELVILETLHPNDAIEGRNLLEVEISWSYIILLTAIARYLHLKKQWGLSDPNYRYALQSFVHYAEWMRDHERPFLSEPDQLEYPNDTWTAQDIRKATLMFIAADLASPKASRLYKKAADRFLAESCNKLAVSPEKHNARIQIVLNQNYGPQHTRVTDEPVMAARKPSDEINFFEPKLTWKALITRIMQRVALGVSEFRPSREKQWLVTRLHR